MHRRRRSGFSLIELLIVVAIIAALVGVAVPMFQKNIAESRIAKARQDIDTLKQQITLHDSQEKALTGISLKPLLGRYLQEIPKDPWGNEYNVDANVGKIISWGSDQKAGGVDEEADIIVDYKPQLQLSRAKFYGAWKTPAAGNYFRFQFTKPYDLGVTATMPSATAFLNELVLILDSAKTSAFISFSGTVKGAQIPSASLKWGCTWAVATPGSSGADVPPIKSDPGNGILVIYATGTITSVTDDIRVTSSMAANLSLPPATKSVMKEVFTTDGPLDPKVWGSEAPPVQEAQPIPPVGTENRGVPLERG